MSKSGSGLFLMFDFDISTLFGVLGIFLAILIFISLIVGYEFIQFLFADSLSAMESEFVSDGDFPFWLGLVGASFIVSIIVGLLESISFIFTQRTAKRQWIPPLIWKELFIVTVVGLILFYCIGNAKLTKMNSPSYWIGLGKTALETNNYKEAEKCYEHSHHLLVNRDLSQHFSAYDTLLLLGSTFGSASTFEKEARVSKTNGHEERFSECADKALDQYQKILLIDSNKAEVYFCLANIHALYGTKDHTRKALSFMKKAGQLGNGQARFWLLTNGYIK